MGCCRSFAKCLLLLFNVFVWVAGGTLLGIGIYLRVEDKADAVVAVADIHLYYSGCYLLIFCGAVMFAVGSYVGFVGCCGAMMEQKCVLGTYFAILTIMFIVEVGMGIFAAVAHDKVDDVIRDAFNKTLKHGNDITNIEAQSAISMQHHFKCCGLLHGCKDWENAVAWGCGCTKGDANCTLASNLGCTVGETSAMNGYIWQNDCYDSVVDYIRDNIWVIVGISLGVGFTQLLGMFLTIAVCSTTKRSDYEAFYA